MDIRIECQDCGEELKSWTEALPSDDIVVHTIPHLCNMKVKKESCKKNPGYMYHYQDYLEDKDV